MQFFPVNSESDFQPTYQLVAPAGEKIPVMLVSQAHTFRYLVISRLEWEGDSPAMYEWHPSEGVTCQGIKLEALEIIPLADILTSNHHISPNQGETGVRRRQFGGEES